jgi:cytochrome c peroxidase
MKNAVRLAFGVLLLFAAGASAAEERPWLEKTRAIGAAGKLPAGRISREELERLRQIGEDLFTAKFTIQDGAGRPDATQAALPTRVRHRQALSFSRTAGPDANACSSCHNDPLPGGAGDFTANVFVSEGFINADFDTTDPQFSNERGTNHMFGAGLIELLAREMNADLRAIRDDALRQAHKSGEPVRAALVTKGVSFGFITVKPDGLVDLTEVSGIDPDLTIRPFSQKGVIGSIRQFTINAMNTHHGMQAAERFGARWTGTDDFDGDDFKSELSEADISALVIWQATLPPPVQKIPEDPEWEKAAADGEVLMASLGCTECHRPALPLKSLSFADPGPSSSAATLNTAQVQSAAIYDFNLLDWAADLPRNEKGEVMVPLFGDLKRHKMTDRSVGELGNEFLSQEFVDRTIFITAELWGIETTAPYGHRNDITTLDEMIRAHGGDARPSRDKYIAASNDEKSSVIAFLRSLVIEE